MQLISRDDQSKIVDGILKVKGSRKASFSSESDAFFDAVVDFVKELPLAKKDDTLTKMNNIAKGTLSEAKFKKFKALISKIRDNKIKNNLTKFVKNIEDGKYNKEFKRMYGRTSQVSELFSLFRQAYEYHT